MNIINQIVGSQPISVLFYCFGVILPTLSLLFSYGNFAFRIGEYSIESKKLDVSLPIVLILLLAKLFIISFILFFIYHYVFDIPQVSDNKVVTIKCLLWGLLITVDSFLLNKELVIICKHAKSVEAFRCYLYHACRELFIKYKPLFYIKILLICLLIVMFVVSIFTNNISFITLLLILYIYYNFRTNSYINHLKEDNTNNDGNTQNKK